jgi:hypothetical protein
MNLIYVLHAVIGFCIAYQDWSKQTFSPILLFEFAFLSWYCAGLPSLLEEKILLSSGIGGFLPFLLGKCFKQPSLGKGDVYLLIISSLWVPWHCWPSIFIFIGTLGALWGLLCRHYRQTSFPFAPLIIAAVLPYLY